MPVVSVWNQIRPAHLKFLPSWIHRRSSVRSRFGRYEDIGERYLSLGPGEEGAGPEAADAQTLALRRARRLRRVRPPCPSSRAGSSRWR
ncbi:hypothetical protein LV779_24555 [Streptomyces thinghirensis]|nr:hypothetical protein [Streptomyces thinghirensis]